MANKVRVTMDPTRYIRRCRDGYDTCGELDATIFEDKEVDQVIEDLFYACDIVKCEPEPEPELK